MPNFTDFAKEMQDNVQPFNNSKCAKTPNTEKQNEV